LTVLPATPSQEAANRVRWRAGRRDFYEVHYIQWWDHKNRVGGWLRTLLLSSRSGRDEAATWAGVIDLANPANSLTVKQVYKLASAQIEASPFRIAIGNAEMTNGASSGSIDQGPAPVSWAVAFDTPGMEIAHIPGALRNLAIRLDRGWGQTIRNARCARRTVTFLGAQKCRRLELGTLRKLP
jgi:hypothetical protein